MNDVSPRHRERSALTGFATSNLDRRADLRDKPDAVQALRLRSDTRLTVVAGDTPVLKRLGEETQSVWFSHSESELLGQGFEEVFLGLDPTGAPRFARLLDKTMVEPLRERPELLLTDLRSVALKRLVPNEELGPLGEGKAMLDWHARHRFCAQCGGPTRLDSAGWKRQCDACGAQHFPRTDPVVIMLAVRGDKCLLARQSRFAPGMYSCIAGFVEPGETFEDAVRRETWEEAGLRAGTVRYIASQPWPFPGSLMIGCLAESLNDDIVLDGTELEAGRWFSREEALQMLEGKHPEGFTSPQHLAIANTILKAWAVEGEEP
ncbi:NAD(+) diphosphatase [Bosea caraganae]|uniref:NAD(+) diphosphatase n=1 Tax=Bosea caraganae TaxID=2763117 RepID=A0A370L796_9HYPH|nr:NAD(+) diphosphatase [Bosea caraganae]RDJ24906.1 NAD(+) diphosphatase [Bosea caraganae]RDJ26018.1 NAD(+) diphosphatase [Bosea caraganae]